MDIFIDNFYSSNIFNLKDAVKAMFHDIDIDQELEEFTDYFMEGVKILEENNIENEKSSNV
jgi:predicted hydrolase (HD superfamily)